MNIKVRLDKRMFVDQRESDSEKSKRYYFGASKNGYIRGEE